MECEGETKVCFRASIRAKPCPSAFSGESWAAMLVTPYSRETSHMPLGYSSVKNVYSSCVVFTTILLTCCA